MLRLDLKGEGGLCVGRTREEALQQIHSKEEKKKERWRSEPGSPRERGGGSTRKWGRHAQRNCPRLRLISFANEEEVSK